MDAINELMEDWGLEASGMVCVTSDSGANMVRAASIANWPRVSCFGHNLHNAVNAGLLTSDSITKAIKACRNVSLVTLGFSMSDVTDAN